MTGASQKLWAVLFPAVLKLGEQKGVLRAGKFLDLLNWGCGEKRRKKKEVGENRMDELCLTKDWKPGN